MKKIAIYGKFNDGMLCALREKCPEGFETIRASEGEPSSLAPADYLICRAVAVDASTLKSAPNIKYVQKWGVGYDKIDIKSVGKAGVPVGVCVGGNSMPVAELTVGLMLGVLRNIAPMAERMKKGEWAREQFAEHSYLLHGKTVGLVGIGNIAKRVAAILRGGFGCEVLYYDVFRMSPEQENEMGVRYCGLDELMKKSDIVSIHVPLLDSTAGMINAEKLALMKPTAIIINTSRGGVINEGDLIAALKSQKILGAGLDTYAAEPLSTDSELLCMENVLTTPHCGGNTVDNDINMAAICMDNIAQFDKNGDKNMRAIVNREYLA